jgi:hypothetical protein
MQVPSRAVPLGGSPDGTGQWPVLPAHRPRWWSEPPGEPGAVVHHPPSAFQFPTSNFGPFGGSRTAGAALVGRASRRAGRGGPPLVFRFPISNFRRPLSPCPAVADGPTFLLIRPVSLETRELVCRQDFGFWPYLCAMSEVTQMLSAVDPGDPKPSVQFYRARIPQ